MVLSTISCFLMPLIQVSGDKGDTTAPEENFAAKHGRMLGIGGINAEDEQFPFLARLESYFYSGVKACSGVLVGNRHV